MFNQSIGNKILFHCNLLSDFGNSLLDFIWQSWWLKGDTKSVFSEANINIYINQSELSEARFKRHISVVLNLILLSLT